MILYDYSQNGITSDVRQAIGLIPHVDEVLGNTAENVPGQYQNLGHENDIILDRHGRVLSRNKLIEWSFPNHISCMIEARNTIQCEYQSARDAIRKLEYIILQEAIDMEMMERRNHFMQHGSYLSEASEGLKAFITALISQSFRNRMCFDATGELPYSKKFLGRRNAVVKLIRSIDPQTIIVSGHENGPECFFRENCSNKMYCEYVDSDNNNDSDNTGNSNDSLS